MLLQVFVEIVVQLGTAFSVGLYVATSPCLFPLLPLFLIRNLQSEDSRTKSVIVTGILIIGILLSLAIFAYISTFVGIFFILYYTYIQAFLGAVIIFVGIITLSQPLRDILHLTSLSMRDPGTPTTLAGVFAVGFSYALLAAPCTAPVVIITLPLLFGFQTNALLWVALFLCLAIGVAIPYLAIALVTGEARDRMASSIANSAHLIEKIVGLLLIILGLWLMWPWFYSLIVL